MSFIKGMAHFSIPVTDMERSRKFYCDVVGCRHLFTAPPGHMCFIDAGGACLILVKQDAPVNGAMQDENGVHHSFAIEPGKLEEALARVKASGVEVFAAEDRQGGVVNGPRAYFRDPDGTVLEFIDLTSYGGAHKH